jgi:hypothetical protein
VSRSIDLGHGGVRSLQHWHRSFAGVQGGLDQENDVSTKGTAPITGYGIGMGSGIGGGLGLVAALLLGLELPLGLVAGAGIGVLVGLFVDGAMTSRRQSR